MAAGTPPSQDVSGLSFIDCSCVNVLGQVSRMADEADGSLGLAALQPVVARVIVLSCAHLVIGVHDSLAKAAIVADG